MLKKPSPPATAKKPVGESEAGLPKQVGRFEIQSRLGAGGMGVVYRAFDPLLSREVALKVPQVSALEQPAAIDRFLREPKAAAQLRHPNIVPVYDAGVDGQHYYIASAFIEGQTLESAIQKQRPGPRHAADIVRDLAEALDYAHGLGIVHRDVKPANIMLDARQTPLLMDFGLARIGGTAEKLTHDGAIMGTPAYMAPEQASQEFGAVGPHSDQYSLGVVLYELLCGHRPFSGPPAILIFNALHQAAPRPRSIVPAIPLDLETICLKAMSKQSAERYASCQELADDLDRWLQDRPIQARRIGAVERTARWAKKRPGLAALCGSVLLLACLSSITALGLQRSRGALKTAIVNSESHSDKANRLLKELQATESSIERRELEAVTNASAIQWERKLIAETRRELEEQQSRLGATQDALDAKKRDLQQIARERAIAVEKVSAGEQTARNVNDDRLAGLRDHAESWSLYLINISAASDALASKKIADARAALDACPSKHRSWEWDYLDAICSGRARTEWTTTLREIAQHMRIGRQTYPVAHLIMARTGTAFALDFNRLYSPWIILDARSGKPICSLSSLSSRNAVVPQFEAAGTLFMEHDRMGVISVRRLAKDAPIQWRQELPKCRSAFFSPDGKIVAAIFPSEIWLLSAATGDRVELDFNGTKLDNDIKPPRSGSLDDLPKDSFKSFSGWRFNETGSELLGVGGQPSDPRSFITIDLLNKSFDIQTGEDVGFMGNAITADGRRMEINPRNKMLNVWGQLGPGHPWEVILELNQGVFNADILAHSDDWHTIVNCQNAPAGRARDEARISGLHWE